MTLDEGAFRLPGSPVLWAAVGLVLLLWGRRVFWLLVAAVGFAAGLLAAVWWLPAQPPWLGLAAGVVGGVLGAVAALVLQKLAVALAGLAVGGAAAFWGAALWGFGPGGKALACLAGAALAAILALALFDWALVAVSAVAGALLVLGPFDLAPGVSLAAFLVVALVGIAVQARGLGPRD
jgi:hypothetical protein